MPGPTIGRNAIISVSRAYSIAPGVGSLLALTYESHGLPDMMTPFQVMGNAAEPENAEPPPVTGDKATLRAFENTVPVDVITPVVLAFRDTRTASDAVPMMASAMTDRVGQKPFSGMSISN